jgi:hypothetical protein
MQQDKEAKWPFAFIADRRYCNGYKRAFHLAICREEVKVIFTRMLLNSGHEASDTQPIAAAGRKSPGSYRFRSDTDVLKI